MNHHQQEKAGMYKKMLIFFANPVYSIIWATFERIKKEIDNFVSLDATHTSHMQQHLIDTKGLTKAKNEAFTAMLDTLFSKLPKAYVWALDSGDENLQHHFDAQRTEFTGISEINAHSKIKNLRDILSNNIASMASVKLGADDLTALNKAISAYESTIGTTGAAQSHKVSGTKGVEEVMEPMDQSLDIIDRLMVSEYSASNPEMVKEYMQNRIVEKLPTRHSGISAHMVDAATGKDLEGAGIAVNGKSSLSDIDGIAEIIKIKPGTYNLTITMEGYTPQTSKIVIKRGRITSLEIALVKTIAA